MSRYSHELEVAVAAVREAARLCRAVQEQISPETLQKKDRSPVTVADFGSQALVCRALRAAFPEDPIIAEEDAAELRKDENRALLERVGQHVRTLRDGTDDVVCGWIDYGGASAYSERFWTLDPIDGTKGFLRKEQYAVALALIEGGEIVVAALACPNLAPKHVGGTGAVYAAVRGEGAREYALDGDGLDGVPIHVTANTNSADARFTESVESGHSAHDDAAQVAERLRITAEPVRMDSQAKYGTVARGDADIYLRLPTRPGYVERIWDHAAGVLVIQEAGGAVTDVTGKPLSFRHGAGLDENRGVIATNGRLHNDVLVALAAVGVA